MTPLERNRINILIVGGDKETRLTLNGVLKREGYHLLYANNFTEAVSLLGNAPVGIALVDVSLPGRSGITLLKEIKRMRPFVQVIMMAGDFSVNFYLESMLSGAFEYFNKPIKYGMLCMVIRKALADSDSHVSTKFIPSQILGISVDSDCIHSG